MPVLDRNAGCSVQFTLRAAEEDHAGGDWAGFSVIALSRDGVGISNLPACGFGIGLWKDGIWARSATDLAHAEGAMLDTAAGLIDYELRILGASYSLWAGGAHVLSGALRDYSSHPDPVPAVDRTKAATGNVHPTVGRWRFRAPSQRGRIPASRL